MDKKYLELFLNEAFEYLEIINNCLVEIENESNVIDNYDLIFRNMHTLKGMAAAMNFKGITELSHALEDIFNKLKTKSMTIDISDFDLIYKWIDVLKELINDIAQNGKETLKKSDQINEAKDFLKGHSEQKKEKTISVREEKEDLYIKNKAKIDPLISGGKTVLEFDIAVSRSAPMPSVRVYQIIQKINENGEIIVSDPDIGVLEEDEIYDFKIIFTCKLPPDEFYNIIQSIREIDKALMKPLGSTNIVEEKKDEGEVEKQKERISTESFIEPTIKVKISHLDALVNLIGELIINTIRLNDISREYSIKILRDEILNFQRVTSNLQDRILLARMVPVGQIFNKYPRIIRDLARKFGKKVNFTITGSEIELDRVILDEIDQPLIHLLRNSVDHGVEIPEERKKAGKNEEALIQLTAKREKNRVIIEVRDDGKGLSIEKIEKKAIKMGVATKEKIDSMIRTDIFMLICKPGFTTSETVTDISGRGVGMDVVKNKIDSLNGVLNIDSEKGRFSVFSMILPMTLAIIQTLIVSVRNVKYLLPISNIQETMEVGNDTIQTVKNKEVIFLRDEEIVPIIRMDEVLGFEKKERDILRVVLVELGEKKAGLVFDELHSKQQTVIKSLDTVLKRIRIYSGKGLLSNGEPALILDVASLME